MDMDRCRLNPGTPPGIFPREMYSETNRWSLVAGFSGELENDPPMHYRSFSLHVGECNEHRWWIALGSHIDRLSSRPDVQWYGGPYADCASATAVAEEYAARVDVLAGAYMRDVLKFVGLTNDVLSIVGPCEWDDDTSGEAMARTSELVAAAIRVASDAQCTLHGHSFEMPYSWAQWVTWLLEAGFDTERVADEVFRVRSTVWLQHKLARTPRDPKSCNDRRM